jgi:hypothetical protein
VIERVHGLIQPGREIPTSRAFSDRYKDALQSSPDVIVAHGAVVALLT